MSRRSRNVKSLRRRQPSVSGRASVLIVCEGAKTEPRYFEGLRKHLRLSTLEVEVVGEGAAPITIVDRAIEMRDTRKHEVKRGRKTLEYEYVWCVFDVEQVGANSSLLRALSKANDNSVFVALTNPCVEYWFLLHFADTSALMQTPAEAVTLLKKHISDYHKNMNMFPILEPYTDQAIANAERVLSLKGVENVRGVVDANPSTLVHRVVECLQKAAMKPY